MVRRYPLVSLETARQLSKESRARQLKRQAQRTGEAAKTAAGARAAHQRRLDANRTIEREEHRRLNAGSAHVSDLLAGAAWRSNAERQAACLGQKAEQAQRLLSEELRAEETARRSLSAAEADAKAVARHRALWQDRQAARSQATADDEADDVWLGRRGGRRSKRDKAT